MSWISSGWNWYSYEYSSTGGLSYPHASLVNPVFASVGAALLIGAALQQARAAIIQAKTANQRHEREAKDELQSRISEYFSKAADQLGSDKMEVRLGGIYTLQRIMGESPNDYWPIVNILTAMLRNRARWIPPALESAKDISSNPYQAMSADLKAIISIVVPRDNTDREGRYARKGKIDLSNSNLYGVRLEMSDLEEANLYATNLNCAQLHKANLRSADLANSYLIDASLKEADLSGAKFHRARLAGARLTGAILCGTEFSGADLRKTKGLLKEQLEQAMGDERTFCPKGLRPDHWKPEATEKLQHYGQ